MNPLFAIISLFAFILPSDIKAIPHHVDEKRDVVGTVKDYDKRRGIIVLETYSGWDQKQIKFGLVASKTPRRTVRWLKGLTKDQAAIWVRVGDMSKIRRGVKIEIKGYHYIADEFTIYPKYKDLKRIKE